MKKAFLPSSPALIMRCRSAFSLILSATGLIVAAAPIRAQSLHTPASQHVTSIGASLLATLASDASVSITELGFLYSRSAVNSDPILGGNGVARIYTIGGTGHPSGVFGLLVSNLTPASAYSFRAYANTPQGTIYSGAEVFTTTGNQPPLILTSSPDDSLDYTGVASLGIPRSHHMAVLLGIGEVLVAGGNVAPQSETGSAELYDPVTRSWSATGDLNTARESAVAVLLPDGNVLATGGYSATSYLDSAEIYDVATELWSHTARMSFARTAHTATRMVDGRVLVAGGRNSTGYPAPAEIYDPETGTWTLTGSLIAPRYDHSATLLNDGKILISGGQNANSWQGSAEIYDPASGMWSATGRLLNPRRNHQQTLLGDGRVFVTGGTGNTQMLANTEIYHPASGTWSPGASLQIARHRHTATTLPDGRLLVCGGDSASATDSAEIYSPTNNQWTFAARRPTGSMVHTATLLPDGKVLIAGGVIPRTYPTPLANAGLYGPAAPHPAAVEGTPVTRSGSYFDPEGRHTATIAASRGTITRDAPPGSWVWKTTPTDGPATMDVLLTVTDDAGAQSTTSFAIPVLNQPPTVTIESPVAAKIGQLVSFSFKALDPSAMDQLAGFSWSIDYGDGTTTELVPAGTASPVVRAHTFENSGTFTVKVSATDKDGGLSPAANQIVRILSPLEVWREFHFGSPDNNGIAANMEDPDSDGMVNLIEYAFGLNPKTASSAPLPPLQFAGTSCVISFTAPEAVNGTVIYGAEWSPNLLPDSWTAIPDRGSGVTHTFSVPREGHQQMYFRLTVTPR